MLALATWIPESRWSIPDSRKHIIVCASRIPPTPSWLCACVAPFSLSLYSCETRCFMWSHGNQIVKAYKYVKEVCKAAKMKPKCDQQHPKSRQIRFHTSKKQPYGSQSSQNWAQSASQGIRIEPKGPQMAPKWDPKWARGTPKWDSSDK